MEWSCQKPDGAIVASTCLVPELDVEPEVDVEVLVVVVVEHGVGLPRLPPLPLEGDAGVVDDAVVVGVQQDHAVRHWKYNINLAVKMYSNFPRADFIK